MLISVSNHTKNRQIIIDNKSNDETLSIPKIIIKNNNYIRKDNVIYDAINENKNC